MNVLFIKESHKQFSSLCFISASEVVDYGPKLDLLINHPLPVLMCVTLLC